MLSVTNISKEYPTPSGAISVLKDVTFTLNAGESLAVIGPSGSGKSTLLSILGTLEPPSSGTFELNGVTPIGMTEQQYATFRRNNLGFIFQDHHLLPQCTALENVLVPFLSEGSVTETEKAHGIKLLKKFGLENRLDHRPGELSGGERQRVAIARALVRKPVLVLADEPTGNLDRKTAETIAELFESLLKADEEQKIILVLATHDLNLAKRMKYTRELA
ncbi:MAG: ABC transporter ATP-binding protein [Thermoguttaceae bacterium]